MLCSVFVPVGLPTTSTTTFRILPLHCARSDSPILVRSVQGTPHLHFVVLEPRYSNFSTLRRPLVCSVVIIQLFGPVVLHDMHDCQSVKFSLVELHFQGHREPCHAVDSNRHPMTSQARAAPFQVLLIITSCTIISGPLNLHVDHPDDFGFLH